MLLFGSSRGLGLCMEGQWNKARRVRCTKWPPAAGHLVSLHSVNFFTPHFKGRGREGRKRTRREESCRGAAGLAALKSSPGRGKGWVKASSIASLQPLHLQPPLSPVPPKPLSPASTKPLPPAPSTNLSSSPGANTLMLPQPLAAPERGSKRGIAVFCLNQN